MNLVDVLLNGVRRYPEKLALVCGDLRLTYRTFNERCNRLANYFHTTRISKGSHVALLSKNCHCHQEMFFAAAKTGAVFIPLNYRLSPRELTYIINDSESKALFFAKEYLPVVQTIRKELRGVNTYVCSDGKVDGMPYYEDLLNRADPSEPEIPSINEDEIVAILYTSGTTGYPKGAMISHRNRIVDMINQVTDLEYIEPEDTHLAVGPLYHIGAISQVHGHLYRGATVVILSEFNPQKIFELIERESIRSFWATPTMIQMLINDPEGKKEGPRSIKTITYAGSPMPVELLKRAGEFFGSNLWIQLFGMTETGPQISHLPRKDHILHGSENEMKRLRSVGVECQNVHVRIVDQEDRDVPPGQVGEVIVKSEGVTRGYWKKPEETEQAIRDGWFHTGDMGYMDEDRYLYLVDRKKDMIITGGENVYSTEVENVLYMHPGISEAAVIGVPHEKWVETVKAVVVLKPEAQATEEEIIQFCKENLASYKKPTSVEFVRELPKTPSGKVLKKELRERYKTGSNH
jgi:long-chain acyl-CoA synthetase